VTTWPQRELLAASNYIQLETTILPNMNQIELPEVGDFVSASRYAQEQGLCIKTLMRLIRDQLVRPDAWYGKQALFHKNRTGIPDPVCKAVSRPRVMRELPGPYASVFFGSETVR
jgi:hypothetical protein